MVYGSIITATGFATEIMHPKHTVESAASVDQSNDQTKQLPDTISDHPEMTAETIGKYVLQLEARNTALETNMIESKAAYDKLETAYNKLETAYGKQKAEIDQLPNKKDS